MIRIGILGSDNSHALAFSKLCNIPDENGIYAYEDVRVTAIYGKDDVKGYEEGYLRRFFGESADKIFVAESDEAVVGYISVVVLGDDVRYVYIDDFCVDGEHRGRGIGTRLLRRCEEYSEKLGVTYIALHVEETNASARRLYEKNGYAPRKTEGTRILMSKTI